MKRGAMSLGQSERERPRDFMNDVSKVVSRYGNLAISNEIEY